MGLLDFMKKYCKSCGKRIFAPNAMNPQLTKEPRGFEFFDGWYCDECAKQRRVKQP